jgi:hypothetical protein
MAHIKDLRQRKAGYTGERPYLARYRDPFGKEHTKTFRTQRDARNWLNEQEVAKTRGDWVDPAAGKITFQEFAEQWRLVQVWRPSTAAQVENYLRVRVYPNLGHRPLIAVRPSHVQALIKGLSIELAPGTVETIYRHVAAVFKAAVRDRVIGRTPCEGITLPKAVKDHKIVPLEIDQVRAVADEMPDRWQAAVWGRGRVGAATRRGARPYPRPGRLPPPPGQGRPSDDDAHQAGTVVRAAERPRRPTGRSSCPTRWQSCSLSTCASSLRVKTASCSRGRTSGRSGASACPTRGAAPR